ncbi:MAG: fibronectin type III domain-containing protein [Bacteroidia bacterium]|jgi:hypothetical protein
MLRINFTDITNLPYFVKCTRATDNAWGFDNGKLVQFLADTPRLCRPMGLLVEKSAENLCLYSRDLTNAAWTKTNCTATLNQSGIDGVSSSASHILTTAANAIVSQTFTAASAERTLSIFIKLLSFTTTANIYLSVNGTDYVQVQPMLNVWVRIKVTQTCSNPTIKIKCLEDDVEFAIDVAQLEAGSIATSPIITTSAAVTRNADEAYLEIDQTDVRNWFNPDEGTVQVKFTGGFANNETFAAFFQKSDETGDYIQMGIKRDSTSTLANIGITENKYFSTSDFDETDAGRTTQFELVLSYKDLRQEAAFNGQIPIEAFSAQPFDFANVNRCWLGNKGGADHLNGYVQLIVVGDTFAPITELVPGISTQLPYPTTPVVSFEYTAPNTATLTWAAVKTAIGYLIKYQDDQGNEPVFVDAGNVLTYDIEGLDPTYEYIITVMTIISNTIGIGASSTTSLPAIAASSFQARVVADSGTFEAYNCLTTLIMQLMNNGVYDNLSCLISSNGCKASLIYAALPTNGNSDLGYTRATTAPRFNESGFLVSVASNVPQLNYPIGGGCPYWLLEKQSTNLLQRSNEFDNAYWTKTNTTVVAAAAVSPDGTTNAYLLYPTTTGANRTLDKAITISSGVACTTTVYVKASGFTWFRHFGVNAADGNDAVWFNVSAGTIGTTGSNITSATIESVGSGWYRLRVTQTSSSTTGNFYSGPVDADGSTTSTTNGTDGVYIYEAQIEESSYPTSTIPTTSAAATRNAGNTTSFGTAITMTDMTVFYDFYAIEAGSMAFGSYNGSGNSYVYLAAGGIYFKSLGGTETQIGSAVSLNARHKIAVKRSGTSVKLFVDGALTDTTAVDANNFELEIFGAAKDEGGGISGYNLRGRLYDGYAYDEALSDDLCETLTTL